MLSNLSIQNQNFENFHSYITLAENSPDYIIQYNVKGQIVYLNKKMQQFFNLPYEMLIGNNPHDIWPDDRYKFIEITIDQIIQDGKIRTIELFIPTANEYHQIIVTPSFASDNITINGIILFGRDVTELKHAMENVIEINKKLVQLAHYDPLTGLPNRLSLIEMLTDKCTKTHPFAFMFLDIDGFKEINDSYGHRFGDLLLIETSKIIVDSAPPDAFIVRTGGDEFVIVIDCQQNTNIIKISMEHLMMALSHSITINNIDVYITTSVGVTIFPTDANSYEELLQKADAAMYNAKKTGKNAYSFYDPTFIEESIQRTTISTNLKKALSSDALELYFQPQIDLKSSEIIGVEALLRWFTPEGAISPALFIPIAEETGLILEIGEFVLYHGCQTACKWAENNLLHGRIAINISARQLTHINFLATLERIIKDTHCNPAWVELEITETSIVENPEKMIVLLEILKSKGFYISIDDFGTGYSSLSYLKNLPIDKIKIDISFVRNITHEPKNQTIVKTIIALAKGLGMEVLAEGVETVEEFNFLRENGIDSIQGFYFYKPLTLQSIESIYKQSKY